MEAKRFVILGLFIVFLGAGFFVYFFFYDGSINSNVVVNITRDSYGCLIHNGYTWNSTERSCVLEWVSGPSRYQIRGFNDCVSAGYDTTNVTGSPVSCQAPNGTVYYEAIMLANNTNSSENLTNSTNNIKGSDKNIVYINLTNSSLN